MHLIFAGGTTRHTLWHYWVIKQELTGVLIGLTFIILSIFQSVATLMLNVTLMFLCDESQVS